jgi:hypothetical protein
MLRRPPPARTAWNYPIRLDVAEMLDLESAAGSRTGLTDRSDSWTAAVSPARLGASRRR